MLNFKIKSIIKITFTIWASFALGLSAQSDRESTLVFQDVDSLHLGQTPPGAEPERFHPELFPDGIHSAPTFTPDGTEMFWSGDYTPEGSRSRLQRIFHSRFVNGSWSDPEIMSFSGEYSDGGPFLNKNGTRLFFYSNNDIWFVDRTDTGWGEPQRLPINTDKYEAMASVADDGTIFFQSNRPGTRGTFDVYYAEYTNGTYAEPKNIGSQVNCPSINLSPLIAPDQSFLIIAYSNNEPNNGLHIAFKKRDGTWTKPVNMGDKINLTSAQRFPGLSPDGKYFFFVRGGSQGGLFWVDTKIIDELRPKDLK